MKGHSNFCRPKKFAKQYFLLSEIGPMSILQCAIEQICQTYWVFFQTVACMRSEVTTAHVTFPALNATTHRRTYGYKCHTWSADAVALEQLWLRELFMLLVEMMERLVWVVQSGLILISTCGNRFRLCLSGGKMGPERKSINLLDKNRALSSSLETHLYPFKLHPLSKRGSLETPCICTPTFIRLH